MEARWPRGGSHRPPVTSAAPARRATAAVGARPSPDPSRRPQRWRGARDGMVSAMSAPYPVEELAVPTRPSRPRSECRPTPSSAGPFVTRCVNKRALADALPDHGTRVPRPRRWLTRSQLRPADRRREERMAEVDTLRRALRMP
jgi:hypothetical protein